MNTLFSAAMFPIMILNMVAGIIAGIWFMFIGKWHLTVQLILIAFLSGFAVSIALMPGALLAGFFIKETSTKGSLVVGSIVSNAYTYIVFGFWTWLMMDLFFPPSLYQLSLPAILATYCAATSPVKYLASKEQDNPFTLLTTSFFWFYVNGWGKSIK